MTSTVRRIDYLIVVILGFLTAVTSLFPVEPPSVESIQKMLDSASGEDASRLVKQCFELRRTDLVMACFGHRQGSTDAAMEFRRSTDEQLRASVAAAFLRKDRLWLPPDRPRRGGVGVARLSIAGLVAPVIQAHVGESGTIEQLMENGELRLRLATALDAVGNGNAPSSEELSAIRAAVESAQFPRSSGPPVTLTPIVPRGAAVSRHDPSGQDKASNWLVFAGVLGFVCFAWAWMIWKRSI